MREGGTRRLLHEICECHGELDWHYVASGIVINDVEGVGMISRTYLSKKMAFSLGEAG